ncbi:hypothetical protein [Ammoniphilus resinae]|uniref:Phage head-tail adaptor n=1 Tax=Ammoniphilus resinae TaxID=861532 RepID=A0ABS4GXU7_9BACL|nr:hypothetical protein [Ammoniphilus resinae]MBP1935100.1 hypothetical protein [Ammoniphilus resinae]
MRLPKTVQIIDIEKQYDDLGRYLGQEEIVVTEFKAEIEPYSTKLAETFYGTTVTVTNRLFCYPISQLELGSIVKWGDKKFQVTSLMDYERHFEVLLELRS